jgi:hypothetical protein
VRHIVLAPETIHLPGRRLPAHSVHNPKAQNETHLKGLPDRNKRYFPRPSWTASARSPFLTFRQHRIHLCHCEVQTVAIPFPFFTTATQRITLIPDYSARPPNRCHNGKTQSLARPLAQLCLPILTRTPTSATEAEWTAACTMPRLSRKRCKNIVKNHHTCPRNRHRRMVPSTLMLTAVSEDPVQAQALLAALIRSLHCEQRLLHMEMKSKCG